MMKIVVFALAGWFGLVAVWLLISPLGFYTTVPGVADSGPLNLHFARDVGLAFLVSAVALFVGAQQGNRVTLEDVLETDAWARRRAVSIMEEDS